MAVHIIMTVYWIQHTVLKSLVLFLMIIALDMKVVLFSTKKDLCLALI